MTDTFITSTVSNAKFADGSILSGSWTAEYDSSGTLVAVSNATITVTGSGGSTTFTQAGTLPYAQSASGAYEIRFGDMSGGSYSSLYLDWKGEKPTTLDAGNSSQYTSVVKGSSTTPIKLATTGTVTDAVACFAAGTRISLSTGEVAVEALDVGDLVLLENGALAPIVWIGSRTLQPRSHSRPETVQPVRISAGALAAGVPARDLVVSPDHAIHLRGHLIPAKTLVNGCNIVQLDVATVTYYHVELPEHAILLAEKTPAESYLDTGNHGVFGDRTAAVVVHPDLAQLRRETGSCAPLVETGPLVEGIRADILWRADVELTADAGLQIRYVDEAALIESRTAIPAEVTFSPVDRRVLGVKIAALRIDGRAVPLDHPELVDGWHDAEEGGRWTSGAAVVPASLLQGSRTLEITLAATLLYRAQPLAA